MKRVSRTFVVVAAVVVIQSLIAFAQEMPPVGRYQVVPAESRIQVKAGTSGMLGFLGHGHVIEPKVFSGEMDFKPQENIPVSLSIRIDATTLYESAEFSQDDKQKIERQLHDEVLETAKYPEITFQSTSVSYTSSPGHVFDAQIDGNLTLHGVTRKIKVPARIITEGNILRTTGHFEIDRKDYNIETKSAGGGTVKVSKTLEATFSIVLKQ